MSRAHRPLKSQVKTKTTSRWLGEVQSLGECRGKEECSLVKVKKVKALQIGSIQHVSRSGEKGWNDDNSLSSLAVSP